MIPKEVRFSILSVREMFAMYNEHAARIGRPPMRKRPKDRVEMARQLAVLLTYRAVPVAERKGRKTEVRDAAIEELCRIAHYEDRTKYIKDEHGKPLNIRIEVNAVTGNTRLLTSVGYPYDEVIARVKARLPHCGISRAALRLHASHIRNAKDGYKNARLPDRRPHSNKGKGINAHD